VDYANKSSTGNCDFEIISKIGMLSIATTEAVWVYGPKYWYVITGLTVSPMTTTY
jgi:hypothetical protein